MDYSPPGSSVHGIPQAWILEGIAISFSRGSSWPRDRTSISCIAGSLMHCRWILYLLTHQGLPGDSKGGCVWDIFPALCVQNHVWDYRLSSVSTASHTLYTAQFHFFAVVYYFFLLLVYLFSCVVLVAVCGIFVEVHRICLVMACGLSCPKPCGILILVPQPGIIPAFLTLQGRFLTIGPPGKSLPCSVLQLS